VRRAARAVALVFAAACAGACEKRARTPIGPPPRLPLLRAATRPVELPAGSVPLRDLLNAWTAAGGPAVAVTASTAQEFVRRDALELNAPRVLGPQEIGVVVEELLRGKGFALAAGAGRPAAFVTIEAWPGPPASALPPPAVDAADLELLDAHPALIVAGAFEVPDRAEPLDPDEGGSAPGLRASVSGNILVCRGLARDVARFARRSQVPSPP
jgi:hypothetical protein